ncbi:MAG: hypothetical protein IJ109_02450 [Firmicutes bacterium]|nr:hypothetical protein [Bacillota bacterium]
MDAIRLQLERAEYDLKGLLRRSDEELRRMPEGYLGWYHSDGRACYTHITGKGDSRERRGINRDPGRIVQLARQDYVHKLQEAAEWNDQLLHGVMREYRSMDPADLVRNMSAAARSIPVQSVLSAKGSFAWGDEDARRRVRMRQLQEWARQPFEQSTYKPEEKIHLTSSGIYVRSKSETLISEKLFDFGVGNRYEQILWLEGRRFAPDFTFLDALGEPFYWEHAGRMDIEKYVRRHRYKMQVYERNGIVPWKNLIVTYDTEDGAINMGLIDSIVRFQILPQL